MVETKPSCYTEWNKSNNLTDKNKGQSSNPKRYRGKKMWTKTQGPELEAETDFKGWCSNLDRYIFDIGMRNSYKLARTMKDMERYLGATYIDRL